jgi:hypothetical protein
MTDDQYKKIGKSCREAVDGNFLVGAFAAQMVGEDYPFSKAMAAVVFETHTDLDLGKRFEEWIRRKRL